MDKPEEHKKTEVLGKAHKNLDNRVQEQHSMQQNRQELDQKQEVDVNPSQINLQKIDVTINTKLENYSGRIRGNIYTDDGDSFDDELWIYVYFGAVNSYPVYKGKPDKNGAYIIEDLPPGFYSVEVIHESLVVGAVYNIKVLPGQTTDQPLCLMKHIRKA